MSAGAANRSTGTEVRERYTYDADGNLTESYVAGDMNCDGKADLGDISLFQEALVCSDNPECCEQNHPDCPFLNADINGDGVVNFGDIDPFVALLSPP